MNEQSFRRLAADAVGGRLDDDAYAQWKAFAKDDPEREAFVARISAAHDRLSKRTQKLPQTITITRTKRVPRRVFWMLAPFFALFGALGGGLAAHSYLQSQKTIPPKPDQTAPVVGNVMLDNVRPDDQPEPDPHEDDNREPKPAEPEQPPPNPEQEQEPDPEPGPEAESDALTLTSGEAKFRRKGASEWAEISVDQPLGSGDRVVVLTGDAGFQSTRVGIRTRGRSEFEITGNGVRFVDGELTVWVNQPSEFTAHKTQWGMTRGAFVVRPDRFTGSLRLLEGSAEFENETIAAPTLIQLTANLQRRELTPAEIRELETGMLGAHDALLRWDGETEATTPEQCELVAPGALGDGHAMTRAAGQRDIGALPGIEMFTGVEGARLRMRVKTNAGRLLIEMRMQFEDGYRAVEAHIKPPEGDGWGVIDVPLSLLKAGRERLKPGWRQGRAYSAFTISAAVDPSRPLLRRELAIDDVLIYTPRK